MTKNSGEIPSNPDEQPKVVAFVPTAMHYPVDGEPIVRTEVYKSDNVSAEEADGVVEQYLGPNLGVQKAGRNMAHAAFGTWNSDWETEADRKKRENAHLN